MIRNVLVGLALCTSVFAAESITLDPASELEKKQAARNLARAATTQVSVGEFDDLKAQVKTLSAQLNAVNARTAAATNKPAPPRRFTEIEVGMTKDELLQFVSSHRSTMKLGMFSTDAGGVQSSKSQTIVTRNANAKVNVNSTGAPDLSGKANSAGRNQVDDGGSAANTARSVAGRNGASNVAQQTADDTTVENLTQVSKKSTVTVTLTGFRQGVLRTNETAMGTVVERGEVSYVAGKIRLELTDDVVTSIKSNETND